MILSKILVKVLISLFHHESLLCEVYRREARGFSSQSDIQTYLRKTLVYIEGYFTPSKKVRDSFRKLESLIEKKRTSPRMNVPQWMYTIFWLHTLFDGFFDGLNWDSFNFELKDLSHFESFYFQMKSRLAWKQIYINWRCYFNNWIPINTWIGPGLTGVQREASSAWSR